MSFENPEFSDRAEIFGSGLKFSDRIGSGAPRVVSFGKYLLIQGAPRVDLAWARGVSFGKYLLIQRAPVSVSRASWGVLPRARRPVVAAPGVGAQRSVGFGSRAGPPFPGYTLQVS